ncbi:hypothetical protein [Serinicoccus sp. CUA-874]|uniref:hypothetical protein n=1 Tax=Serinicoccus sp. CUA-874 TaxID=1517939 RepID=UPI0039E1AB38
MGRVDHLDLLRARAHWLTRDLLAVPATAAPQGTAVAELSWELALAPEGGLDPQAPPGSARLVLGAGALPDPAARRWPHLAAYHALHLADEDVGRVEEILTGQVALLGRDGGGALRVATSLQVPGVLDDLYASSAASRELGVSWQGPPGEPFPRVPTVRVWAPPRGASTCCCGRGGPSRGGSVPGRRPASRCGCRWTGSRTAPGPSRARRRGPSAATSSSSTTSCPAPASAGRSAAPTRGRSGCRWTRGTRCWSTSRTRRTPRGGGPTRRRPRRSARSTRRSTSCTSATSPGTTRRCRRPSAGHTWPSPPTGSGGGTCGGWRRPV